MAGNKINLMDLRLLIQLKQKGYSNRQSAGLLGVGRNAVNRYVKLFEAHELSYTEFLKLDSQELDELLPSESEVQTDRYKQLSEYFGYFEGELRKPGCRIKTLWQEYIEKHPDGYSHSQFGHHFKLWRDRVKSSGKLDHKAAEQLYVDFTGKKLEIVDKYTGEITKVEVFVGILPCSQYTFVTAVKTQQREDFIHAVTKCLRFMGGVPQAIVPDNLKSAVSKAHKYAPEVNKTFKDMALHYNCVIDPTRPYAPQDKALVENAVNLVYQRIFYPLSKHIFFSLESLNKAIAELLEKYNNYTFSQRNQTRLSEFLSLEKDRLQPLPEAAYQIKYYKRLKVQKMGHVYLSDDKHYYSVPYRYIGKQVQVAYSRSSVEIYHNFQRIATHSRDYTPGKYTTDPNHMSSSHKAYSEWSLEFFQNKAKHIGPSTHQYITGMILQRPYPEVAYKQAMGIIQLRKEYSTERIENACQRALSASSYGYHMVANILKKGLDKELDLIESQMKIHIPTHTNIRGADTYE